MDLRVDERVDTEFRGFSLELNGKDKMDLLVSICHFEVLILSNVCRHSILDDIAGNFKVEELGPCWRVTTCCDIMISRATVVAGPAFNVQTFKVRNMELYARCADTPILPQRT